MSHPTTTEREAWLAARLELLAREKQHLREGDALAAARRALPQLEVTQEYLFSTEHGDASLADLFAEHSQLIVQHFMFGRDWDAGCPSCSFWADGYDPMLVHLGQRDTSFVAVSVAPITKLLAYRKRMGWSFPWVSSGNNSFSVDYGVSASAEDLERGSMRYNYRETAIQGGELPGISVFRRDEDGRVYYCYSSYGRGLDSTNAAYAYLDLLPKGRDEEGLPWPMAWLKRHDEY